MRKLVIGLLMVGGLFLSPGLARADLACILQAKDDFRGCRADCLDNYRDDKFRCRNVDPACGNACLAGRERCLEPFLQVLTNCLDGCRDTLKGHKTDCASMCQCGTPQECRDQGNTCYQDCLDPFQIEAFVCRDNCRESFHNDQQLQDNIHNCRASFRACVHACPPAQ